jgi:hypothetical protein
VMRIGFPIFVNRKDRIEDVYAWMSVSLGKTDEVSVRKTYEGIGSGENNEAVVRFPIFFDEFSNIVPF